TRRSSDLNNVLIKRSNLNYRMTIHSDQGYHYQHKSYINILKENNAFQSMSRKANCLDNYLKKPVNEFIINSFTGHFSSIYAQSLDRKSKRLNSSHVSISYAV